MFIPQINFRPIRYNKGQVIKIHSNGCAGTRDEVAYMEHVQLMVSLDYTRRGDLTIHLTSPSGTKSCLLSTRSEDLSDEGFSKWPFMTTHSWGEDPRGMWTLEIKDFGDSKANHGVVTEWQLILHGTKLKPNHQPPDRGRGDQNPTHVTPAQPAAVPPVNHVPRGPTYTFVAASKQRQNNLGQTVASTHVNDDHVQINIEGLHRQQQQQSQQLQQQSQQLQQQSQQLQQQARKKLQQLQLQLQKQQQEQAQFRQLQQQQKGQQQQQNIQGHNIFSSLGPQGTHFISPQVPRVPFPNALPNPYFGPHFGPPAAPPVEPNIALSNNERLELNQMRWANPMYRSPAVSVNPYSGYLRTYGKRGTKKPNRLLNLLKIMKLKNKYKQYRFN